MNSGGVEKALSLLGMARRARVLIVGQDRVIGAVKEGAALVVVASADCSQNVLRKISSAKCGVRMPDGLSREALGAAVGVLNAQIVALPHGSGFAKKLIELLK